VLGRPPGPDTGPLASVGDRRFFAMLRAWVQQHRNVEADRALFTSWLKRHTGRNLTPLVDRWLDSRTTPPADT
jgi:hypothetical protein